MVWRIKNRFGGKKREKGYFDPKFAALKKYESIHEGERCFIICTGPSLTLNDVEKLKNEYTFSMNSIIKLYPQTDWRPTYYVIEDIDVYMKLENDLNQYQPSPLFISDWLAERVKPKFAIVPFPFDMLNHFDVGFHKFPKYRFSKNAYAMLYHGYSVTYLIMQLAVYMGFKEIYLLGCDCNYSGEKRHFKEYNIPLRYSASTLERKMIRGYQVAREYCDAYGVKIYNATRGGKLEVFERVDFDKLLRGGYK